MREGARQRIILKGDVPSPANPPKGCNFCTRCPKVFDRCRVEKPALREVEPGRLVACHLYDGSRITSPDQPGATKANVPNQQGVSP